MTFDTDGVGSDFNITLCTHQEEKKKKVGDSTKNCNSCSLCPFIQMPTQPIMFDGDSPTMLLHHVLGINIVTEKQN